MMRLGMSAVGVFLAFLTNAAFACDLEVVDPWVREAPPAAEALAGYMVLQNHGGEDCVLTGVSAAGFKRAMFHRTEHEGDMASMKHQNDVRVAAGKQVVFEPNGLHIMLMGPEQPLKKGDQVSITLVLDSGKEQSASFPVRLSPPR